MPKLMSGVPAAAGYHQLVDSLSRPIVSKMILAKAVQKSIVSDITVQDYLRGILTRGSSIEFMTKPTVKIYPYQKNQTLDNQEVDICWSSISIDQTHYYNIKFDHLDRIQIPNWDDLEDMFKDDAADRFAEVVDRDVVMAIARGASPKNKGNAAGSNGTVALGTYGAPLTITATNIVDVLTRAQMVLAQQNAFRPGMSYIVLPMAALGAFNSSVLTNASAMGTCCDGDGKKSPLMTGKLEMEYMGFKLLFTNYLPAIADPSGGFAYPIIFGSKKATGFGVQVMEHEKMKTERSFGTYIRGLWAYGRGVMMPEEVGVIWAKF